MQWWEAIVLGLVQGFSEFLPVSSSGHLVIAQNMLGLTMPDITFDVAVHLGSLFAVFVALRQDITNLVIGVFRQGEQGQAARKLAGWVVLGTIPVGLVGVLFSAQIEGAFGSARFAASMLVVTGLILFAAERYSRRGAKGNPIASMGLVDTIVIGLAQACAILPGISRSGSTISAGIARGFDREAAARFSFLLSIPAIMGASVVSIPKAMEGNFPISILLVGMAAAAVSGYLAIGFLLKLMRGGRLSWFSYYVWLLAALFFFFA